ncbi:MAG: hypothetical protein IKQ69_02785 [Oscillospiraceae bacterium]|nr:hypothetical protein [Oscillospiraceae bacterium]
MIQKLTFGEPFIAARYIEQEADYAAPDQCILVNLDTEQPVLVENGFSLPPLQACEIRFSHIRVPGKALLLRHAGTVDLNDLQTLDILRKVWKSNWELTHLPQHRGVPYYKSPKVTLGKLSMNLCLVAEPECPSGIHREHDRPIRELHVQVVGQGAVDLLRSPDPASVYASLPLAAGTVHIPEWNAEGVYPWHRYRSVTRCIFLAVSIEE